MTEIWVEELTRQIPILFELRRPLSAFLFTFQSPFILGNMKGVSMRNHSRLLLHTSGKEVLRTSASHHHFRVDAREWVCSAHIEPRSSAVGSGQSLSLSFFHLFESGDFPGDVWCMRWVCDQPRPSEKFLECICVCERLLAEKTMKDKCARESRSIFAEKCDWCKHDRKRSTHFCFFFSQK